jgi:hypothetical protein
VVVCEPLKVVLERMQARRREDARLSHLAAEHPIAVPWLDGARAGVGTRPGETRFRVYAIPRPRPSTVRMPGICFAPSIACVTSTLSLSAGS